MGFFQINISCVKPGNLLFVSILLNTACNLSEEKGGMVIKKECVSFPTPRLVPVNPQVYLVESDTADYLKIYNYFDTVYQFLEFPSGKLLHEIPLKFEGPNSVPGFAEGTITSRDTLWVLTNPPAISLMDFNGKIIFRKKVENNLIPISFLSTSQDKPLFQYRSRIFGAQPLFMDHHGITKNDIKKHQLIYSYDFKTDSVRWYDVFYSDDFWEKGKKLSDYSWAQREGKIYIAPLHDHEIQVFDMATGKVLDRKQVKSSEVNRFHYVNEFAGSPTEALQGRISYDKYGPLIYDKYRDVFYRFFLPAVKLDKDYSDEELNNLNFNRPYIGLMVLDKGLNVREEHLFNEYEVFINNNFFVGEKGLYLFVNNIFHSDYNEEEFRYLVMTFD